MYRITEETRRKISTGVKKYFEEHPEARVKIGGHPQTEETRRKISQATKGRRPENFELLRLRSPFVEGHIQLNTGRTHFKKGNVPHNWLGGISKTVEYKRFYKSQYKHRKRDALGSHTFDEWMELKSYCQFMCGCCKKQEPEITLTEDHIIPISKGGSNDISNIQPLCGSCNSRKSNKTINYLKGMVN